MNELLKELRMDDLNGRSRELAEIIGLDGFIRLVDRYGGTSNLYIPQADGLVLPIRDNLIRREFDGGNYSELALKWGLTDRYVREMVKDKAKEIRRTPMTGQMNIFDINQ